MTESQRFLDTNLWVYLYSNDPKANIVDGIIRAHFEAIWVSTQVLNELYSVLTRKNLKSPEESQTIISEIIDSYSIYCIDEQCIRLAMDLNIRHHLSYWDSLIIAAALEANCAILYSEDMQHGQLFNDQLRIVNPFREMRSA
jgi:predicted nucleic acid-binding protein